MKFSHEVKHNGVYYPVGADVPIEETNGGVKAPVDVSGKVDDDKEVIDVAIETAKNITDDVQAKSDIVWADFDKKTRKYSEEDLNLPYMKLKALAKKNGFKVENTMKANELKDMLRSL